MRTLALARRKIYWLVGAALVIVLWYQYSSHTNGGRHVPVLSKSFIRRGNNILYGPFVSEAYKGQAQSNHSITFATHSSLKNLYHLQLINLVWKSPISVAIWAHGDLAELVELIYILTLPCAGRQSLSISIIVPANVPSVLDVSHIKWEEILSPNPQTCSQRNIHNRFYALRSLDPYQNYNSKELPYPNNRLRNIALSAVKTSHVIVSDIDMLPSVNMDELFMQFFHHSSSSRKSDNVLVVPVFESRHSQVNQWTIPRLIADWQIGKVRQFYIETCPQCQGATQYSNWVERQTRADNTRVRSSPNSSVAVLYLPGWEPFAILSTDSHPQYDERFEQFGYNRMSLICELHMSGKSFHVLDKMFLIHDGFKMEEGFHAEKDKELKNNELLYQKFRSELSNRYKTKRHC